MRIFSSLGNLLRLACLARRIKARAVSPERVAVLDDSVFVETTLLCSFSSSYMFTLSGPTRSARIRLPPQHPVRPTPGRPGPRCSGSLIPVGGELSSETVAYRSPAPTPISAEVKQKKVKSQTTYMNKATGFGNTVEPF